LSARLFTLSRQPQIKPLGEASRYRWPPPVKAKATKMFIATIRAVLISCAAVLTCQGRRLDGRRRNRTGIAPGRNSFRQVVLDDEQSSKRRTIANMTCDFVEQPLNHFSLPRDSRATYRQRYCVDNTFVLDPSNATVFLYTGNESPLEEYINNTGLMWELAEFFNAQIVFIEHRYEGKSFPSPEIPNCMAYSSSIQAIADFAVFIERQLFSVSNCTTTCPSRRILARPVIAFGGSYGGMLSAWLRMKYPNLVAGAIAGSAPIWGFPSNFPDKIDSAWQVVQRGLARPYPPTDEGSSQEDNHCSRNLLAAWPLMQFLGEKEAGRLVLTESFRLCSLLGEDDIDDLIDWAQSPWFDLAEGSFPYPSSYIPYALTHKDRATLPAWPLQAACWKHSKLHQDLGIRFTGNVSDVRYEISYAESGLALKIDWDNLTALPGSSLEYTTSSLSLLLGNVRDAISIWYNISGDASCYELLPAPNIFEEKGAAGPIVNAAAQNPVNVAWQDERVLLDNNGHTTKNSTEDCRSKMKESGSWEALCCNEEMNLIITEARGLGRDFLWPPSHPRGTRTHEDVVAFDSRITNWTDFFCSDPADHYGYPKKDDPRDPWSTWLDTVYGGVRIRSQSNIVFSNGLLDPWSAAGVYDTDPSDLYDNNKTSTELAANGIVMPGLYLQHINDRDMISLIMKYGGHHTDLMYSSNKDPPSIQGARQIEKEYIAKWIDEWWLDFS
jgi:lysosomal Pro-X carboxypeptidase